LVDKKENAHQKISTSRLMKPHSTQFTVDLIGAQASATRDELDMVIIDANIKQA